MRSTSRSLSASPVTRALALALLGATLAACSRTPAPSADASASSAASATSAAAPAATSETATSAASAGHQESAGSATANDSSANSLERIAALPANAQLPAGKWVPGTNYTVISPAQPTNAPPGKVQVMEVFWYGCPHCYALDPYLESWRMHMPAYIDFERVPVMWGAPHRAHARLFYTLQALGKLDQLHAKVFDEIHQKGDALYVAGNDAATLADQEKFAEANGISGAAFMNAYNSFGVQADLQKADEITRRYKVDGVPDIIIDGKYETDVGKAGSDEKLIELINDLTASEHQRQGG